MIVARSRLGFVARIRAAVRLVAGIEPQRRVARGVALLPLRDRLAWAGRIVAGGVL